MKGKIKTVMVVTLTLVVFSLLLLLVAPWHEIVFASFGSGLPWLTQMVADISRWMQEWRFPVTIALALMLLAYTQARKHFIP